MVYRQEVDGLRALAVLPVILFHAGFQTFSGGFVGVDVFFVISGYLITSIILAEKQAGTFTLINFYERRARRILPALFVVMVACLPFAWLWLLPQDMKSFSQSLVAVSGFASNVLFWQTSGYFETTAELKPLLHTWSLAVEEQYYLLFPIFLMLTWRLGKRWILAMLAVAAVVSLAAAQWGSAVEPAATFYLLPTRGWELLIGAYVAFCFSNGNKGQSSKAINEAGGAIGLLLLIYAIFAFDKQTPFPSLYTLIPTVGTALIIFCASQQTAVGKLLGNKLFVGVGLISYSTYLWHQPLFAFARHKSLDEPSKLLLSALAIAAVVLAYFSWKYVETPFRNKQRFSRKQIFSYGCVGSGLFVAFGLVGHFNEGYTYRFSSVVGVLSQASLDKNPRQADCTTFGVLYKNPSDSCVIGNQKFTTGALIGDSHADTISLPLSNGLAAMDIGFKQMTYAGCAPSKTFFRGGAFRCLEYNDAVRKVLENENYKSVVVMARWTVYLEGTLFDNGEGGVEINATDLWIDGGVSGVDKTRDLSVRKKAVALSYKNAVLDLLNAGKKVILVYPVPEVGWNAPSYAAKKLIHTKDSSVSTSHQKYIERNADAIAALDAIGEHTNLVRIKPEKMLCDTYIKDRCVAVVNDVSLYFDDNHLSNAGAQLVVNEIMKHIAR